MAIFHTKFDFGQRVVVKKEHRGPDLEDDIHNIGVVIEIQITQVKKRTEIAYLLQFDKNEPDWDEEYTEDQLEPYGK